MRSPVRTWVSPMVRKEDLGASGVFEGDEEVDPLGAFAGERSDARRGGRGVLEPEAEGRSVRTPSQPYVPMSTERRAHNATHYPPRSWCRHCVEGRGMCGPHLRREEEQVGSGIGKLNFDYCFLRSRPGEPPATTLIGVDCYTQAVLAHGVLRKGT